MKNRHQTAEAETLESAISSIRTWETEEIETSFLASVCFLMEGDSNKSEVPILLEIISSIDETWFTDLHRKAIFYVIRRIYTESAEHKFLLPGSICMMAKQVLKLRGHENRCHLVDEATSSPSIFYSFESFRSVLPIWRVKLTRNKMRRTAEELLDLFNESPDPSALLDKVPKLIELQQDTWSGLSSSSQRRDDWDSSIDELLSPQPENIAISTGLKVLDEAMQGGIATRNSPYSGRLIVVAARPAMGKSTFAIHLATQLADSHGDVAFFSLEMSKRQIQYKAIACYDYMNLSLGKNLTNPIRANNLRQRIYTPDQRERLQTYKDSPFVKRFHVYDTAENVGSITTKVTLLSKTRPNMSAIFIDYLQLIEGCSGDANNTESSNIGNVTRALKQLAVRTGIDIFLLCQVNRGVESRNDKMPTPADLRASGRIEEDADIVMFLLRPAYYDTQKDPYELAIGVAKNRHGPCGTLRCGIDLQSSVVFDELLRSSNVESAQT